MSNLFLDYFSSSAILSVLTHLVRYERGEESLMIAINYRDTRPIYEQLKDDLRSRIVRNLIEPDEKLPSVRDMATSLSINPNTIQRAYRDLENEGYVYTVAGKGTFASAAQVSINPRRITLEKKLDEVVIELLYLGSTSADLCKRIETITKGGKPRD